MDKRNDSPLQSLIASQENRLGPFIPAPVFRDPKGPAVSFSLPWDGSGTIHIDTPENFQIGKGGKRPDRRSPIARWGNTDEVVEASGWDKNPDGSLVCRYVLEGDIRITYHILPHDRHVEWKTEVDNRSNVDLQKCYSFLCSQLGQSPWFGKRDPLTELFVMKGELASWNYPGEQYVQLPEGQTEWGRLEDKSCQNYFNAFIQGSKLDPLFILRIMAGHRAHRLRSQYMPDLIDLPILTKGDPEHPGCHLILYTPDAEWVMSNLSSPCFHADPLIGDVPSGERRSVSQYLIFFEGELKPFVEKLSEVHRKKR